MRVTTADKEQIERIEHFMMEIAEPEENEYMRIHYNMPELFVD